MLNFKKTKNQVFETAEKNESISVEPTSIFPDAKDVLAATEKQRNSITPEEIIKKINYESHHGNREAKFYGYYITDELANELRSQGYKVEITKGSSVGPYFVVSW